MSYFGGPHASDLRRYTVYLADGDTSERAGVGVEYPCGVLGVDLDDVQASPTTVRSKDDLRGLVRRWHAGNPHAPVDVWLEYEDPGGDGS